MYTWLYFFICMSTSYNYRFYLDLLSYIVFFLFNTEITSIAHVQVKSYMLSMLTLSVYMYIIL